MTCTRCGKRLSRKTARQIDGKPVCSACLFGQPSARPLPPRTMADVIPGWGDFLDGLAAHIEREDPDGWKAMVAAVEARDSGSGPKGGDCSQAPGEAPQSGLSASEGIAHPLPETPSPSTTEDTQT